MQLKKCILRLGDLCINTHSVNVLEYFMRMLLELIGMLGLAVARHKRHKYAISTYWQAYLKA